MTEEIIKDKELECYKCGCGTISFYILKINHHEESTTIQCRECARIYKI